jgi:hypothetical protein
MSVNSGRVHLLQCQLSEDETFTDTQFKVNDFHFWRADRNQYGGGLVAYARSDLACDRKMNLEYQTIESICIEININNRKWLISGLYRPPSISDLIWFVSKYDII